MTSRPAHPGYPELIRSLVVQSRRHRQLERLGLAVLLGAAAALAYSTGQDPMLVGGIAAAAAAVLAWLVVERARLARRIVERVIAHPDQVTSIEQIHRSRAVWLRLRLGTGERIDLKVPARQAAGIAHQLKAHCRHAALHIRA